MALTRAFWESSGDENLLRQGLTENEKQEVNTSCTVQVTSVRHFAVKESREMGQYLEGQAGSKEVYFLFLDGRNKFMLVCQWEVKTQK